MNISFDEKMTDEIDIDLDNLQDDPEATVFRRELLLTAVIWIPSLLLMTPFFILDLKLIGISFALIAFLIHTLLRPAFPTYLLLFVIPIEWMVTVVGGFTTISKPLAVVAMFFSIPKILTCITRKWDPCAKWIMVMVVWSSIGIVWSQYPLFGLHILLTMILLWVGLPLIICVNVRTPAAVKGIMLVFLLGCLLSSIGIITSRDLSSTLDSAERANVASFVGSPSPEISEDLNIISRYLAIGVLICIYMVITVKKQYKALFTVAILLLITAIILLKGRAVYVGLPTAIVLGVLFLRGAGFGKRVLLIVTIGIIGGIVALFIMKMGLLGEGVQNRFLSIFEQKSGGGHRSHLWAQYMNSFFETGFRGEGLAMGRFAGPYRIAHNDLLTMMGDLGIVGLVVFFGIHATLFFRSLRVNDIWAKLFCIMVQMFMLFTGITESDFLNKYYVISFTLILATLRIDALMFKQNEYQYCEYEP